MESLNEEVKFTVYATRGVGDDGFFNNSYPWEEVTSLQALIDKTAAYENGAYTPIAWTPGHAPYGGRAAAIAAGRLIEKQADGSFIPRGVGGEALFRVGGIYCDTDGNLVRLYADPEDSSLASCMSLEEGKETEFDGCCQLSDGRDPTRACFDLIPGELNEQGEPISCGSPIAATPPTTEPSPSEARENERGGLTIAQWKAIQAAKPEAIAAAKDKAEREAIKTRGCAGNPHPHWGAAVGLVK